MKGKLILILIVLISKYGFAQTIGILGDKASTIQRIENIKQSTGKILIDDVKSGTGFYVSSDGIVVTNWHVLFNERTKIDNTGKILNTFKFVDFKNDTIPLTILLNISKDLVVKEAMVWDYCILKATTNGENSYLKFGNFTSAYEGETVYTCGFPLDLNEPFISTGIISSIFSQAIGQDSIKYDRKVAWLDMTTNKGNSGGPLVFLADKPENDRVIGLTSFITTPYFNTIDNLNKYIAEMEKRGGVQLMGIDFLQYAKLINTAVNANSVGISGCISIERVATILNGYNK
jgi:S1-C subfamily serine protease